MTPARFQVVISAPVESRALIDIVWGTTFTNCSWSHIASHEELESTGRVRRRFSYLMGPRRFWVKPLTPP
jgi:hypothetical protein